MFGSAKKQKVDKKALFAVEVALDNWMDVADVDSLLAETGKTRQELLDAVMADDEVVSCREDIEGAIKAATWRVWGEDVDEEVINKLYKSIRRLLPKFIGLAILAKWNGYAIAEYFFEREENGFLALSQVASKDGELDKYTLRRDGSTVLSLDDSDIIINQQFKHLVLTSNAVPARPSGELLIIRAYPAVALRKKGWAYAGQFIARYAQPYVVGKQGSDSGFGSTVADFTSKIFAFISGGAIGVSKDDSVELLQLNGDGEAFDRLERLANRRIQKLLLGRVKTSELVTGSRSAQETDDTAREGRISTYLGLMTEAVQHAIDAVIAVNKLWGVPIYAPQGIWFEYPDVKTVSKEEAEIDATYVGTGQVRLTKQRLLNVGYEESEFEIVEPGVNGLRPLSLSHNDSHTGCGCAQQNIQLSQNLPNILTADNDAQDAQSDKERELMMPKIQAILALSESCNSYDEFVLGLSKLELPDAGLVADLANELIDNFADGLSADNTDKGV